MRFLEASDNVFWQTNLSAASKASDDQVRHTVTVTMPKPAGARKAWLITNIGTSIWGSNMIRKTVEYRGSTAEAWLNSVNPGSQPFAELYQFLEREEMYHLKTWVKDGPGWTQHSLIQGQGPLISEDRVYPIDVSSVTGDSLVLRFDPPKGFWTFDYLGVTYEPPAMQTPASAQVHRAENQSGTSLVTTLMSNDSLYYSMPEAGDLATLGFSVPPQPAGTARAVYLETTGYYELHLTKDRPAQLARLYNM
jgi:hypothetical protein